MVLALIEAVSFYVRNRSNGSIVSSGETREYLLHVPASYDRTQADAARDQHARRGHCGQPRRRKSVNGTRWPTRKGSSSSIRRRAAGTGPGSGARAAGPACKDVRFISDLIDTLRATYNIDPARIYANGLSNGGGMAFVLSCTLSDRIAAVGMVAAAQLLPWSWCTDPRPVPMIAFHGTDDPAVPYTVVKRGRTRSVSGHPGLDAEMGGEDGAAESADSAVAANVTRRDIWTRALRSQWRHPWPAAATAMVLGHEPQHRRWLVVLS